MRFRCLAALTLSTAVLGGCGVIYKLDVQQGNLFDKASVDSLKPGMTKHQVTLIMGSPSIISPFDQNRWDYVSTIRRGRNQMASKDLTLYFKDDALAKIEGDYFPVDPDQLIKDARKYKRDYPDEKRPDEKKKQGQGG
ncbi:MAG: outer membrane protein assembly factor BamE [Rhodanobacteraceae bacterium]